MCRQNADLPVDLGLLERARRARGQAHCHEVQQSEMPGLEVVVEVGGSVKLRLVKDRSAVVLTGAPQWYQESVVLTHYCLDTNCFESGATRVLLESGDRSQELVRPEC